MGKPVNPMAHVRCVLVGNAAVGKTSLIVAYTTNGFCDRYKPTAFDNYSVTVSVDNKPLKLDLCDTAGGSEFDTLRPLSYAEANVFLLCFNVMQPQSFESITHHWLPEIRAVSPNAAVIFVGTQSDLRMNMNHVMELQRKGASPACPKTIRRAAEQFRVDYIECSALTKHNLKEVFDLAILHGLRHSAALCAGVPPSPLQQRRFLSSSQEKAKTATTSFKEGFRKFVTMTKRLI
ncbi:Ras family protein [Aphelenchoides avenae]|nr:Ras family protein [Aphelenchus avenae]